jgi:tetratricopeptide (TPR) repeat protein
MKESANGHPTAAPSLDDPRLVAALEEYMAALEEGAPPDRQAFLARHAAVAPALEACLDGVNLVRAEAPKFLPEAPADTPLGDFRLVREIGRGGMGVVYEAVQLSLERTVALKVLPFAAALDARQLQRFKNEAQAAAQLHHGNIVPVYAVGCDRGVHFYAMQLIEGRSLAALIQDLRRRTPEAPAEPGAVTPPAAGPSTLMSARSPAYVRMVVELAVQAAEALDYAHQVGVVHRDVKPANLLVDTTGRLWVTDFGLARCQAGPGVTRTGDVVGTLRYMSPEQALSRHGLIDHRSDVYSLGVTLYEALTLQPPFPGRDREELLRQLALGDPPPPRRLNPALPAELETIVLKAMAPEPEQRYATAQELADDLRRWLEHRPVRARRPGLGARSAKWLRRHRPALALAAVLFLLAVAALGVHYVQLWQEHQETLAALGKARENERRARDNFENAMRGNMMLLLRLEDKRWNGDPRIDELRQDLVSQGLAFYEEFLHDDSPDPLTRFETARTCRQMASVYCSQQNVAEAHRMMRRAIALYERLAAEDPREQVYPKELSRTFLTQGVLYTSEGKRPEAAEAFARMGEYLRRTLALGPDAIAANNLAWLLSDCPEPTLRKPAEGVAVARQAVALAPTDGYVWNTLGVACYRAGDIPAAVTALRKSIELSEGGSAQDFFFLAMSYHRLGEHPEARTWFHKAADWVKDHGPPNQDVMRAHREAARLLGLPEPDYPLPDSAARVTTDAAAKK